MIKNRTLRAVILSAVISLLAVSFLAFSASAQVVTRPHLVASHATAPLAVPNSDIKGKPKHEHFVPNTLKCDHTKMPALSITNKTKLSQTITNNGKDIVTLSPGQQGFFNVSGPGTVIVGVKDNPGAKLTITCT